MGVEGEAEELSEAKVEGGELPPSSMLGPSPDRAEKSNLAAPQSSGNGEVLAVTRKGPDTSCCSGSVVMVTLEAGRALQSLKVITSLLLHQMFERRRTNKPATFPTTRLQMRDGDKRRVLLIRFS